MDVIQAPRWIRLGLAGRSYVAVEPERLRRRGLGHHPAEDHAYVLISAAPGAVARLTERLPALSGVVDVTALLGPHDALASVAVRPPLRIRDVVARIAATEGVVDVIPAYLLSAAAAAA